MGACRENANLWFWLRRNRKMIYPRPFGDLVASPYFWHDSFGRYLWQWIGCPLGGHRHTHLIESDFSNEPERKHCFNCEQDIK